MNRRKKAPHKLKVIELSHADRFASELAHCRGIQPIVQYLNMLLREQAPDEQYSSTVQHGSLLARKQLRRQISIP